jgi:FKBP-type peptidyl-prolyl cis-trans isomerase SlyD
MRIVPDTVVTARYRFTDESGQPVDSSDQGGPMVYLHGRDSVLPAIELALAGREIGYATSLTLGPEQAFGAHRPELVFEAVRENLPPGTDLQPGMPLYSGTGDRPAFQLRVVRLTERGAVLDGNHPLAGQTLRVDLEVLDVRAATAEEIRAGRAIPPAP